MLLRLLSGLVPKGCARLAAIAGGFQTIGIWDEVTGAWVRKVFWAVLDRIHTGTMCGLSAMQLSPKLQHARISTTATSTNKLVRGWFDIKKLHQFLKLRPNMGPTSKSLSTRTPTKRPTN